MYLTVGVMVMVVMIESSTVFGVRELNDIVTTPPVVIVTVTPVSSKSIRLPPSSLLSRVNEFVVPIPLGLVAPVKEI